MLLSRRAPCSAAGRAPRSCAGALVGPKDDRRSTAKVPRSRETAGGGRGRGGEEAAPPPRPWLIDGTDPGSETLLHAARIVAAALVAVAARVRAVATAGVIRAGLRGRRRIRIRRLRRLRRRGGARRALALDVRHRLGDDHVEEVA